MTNPNNAVGTNAAYGTRTSVNAFGDVLQVFAGRGVVSGWAVVPDSGMTVNVGGVAGTRDVAVAEDNLGNRTSIDNRSGSPVSITLAAASVSANRYSAIVAYCNNPAIAGDTTPDAPDVCGIIEVQGGTTGVSEAQIRTAISADGGTGTTAYYAVLATVYVAANTTTITSGNITANNTRVMGQPIRKVLYSGGSASTSSSSLSEAPSNYDQLEISIIDNDGNRETLLVDSGASYFQYISNAFSGTPYYLKFSRWQISGSTISKIYSKESENYGAPYTGGNMGVEKVVGVKY